MIGSDVHGISELLAEERGLLFPANDTKKLSEMIARLAQSPQLRAQYGRRGYEYVQAKHDIREYVKSLYRLYEEHAVERKI